MSHISAQLITPDKRRQSPFMAAFALTLFMSAFVFISQSRAENVMGVVSHIDAAKNTITINRIDSDNKNLPMELNLTVARDVDFEGLVSLNDLKEGNQVEVDVKENKDLRLWEAQKIELKTEERV